MLNIHWFPKNGSGSVATLYIDGLPAVWSDATGNTLWDPQPVEGSAIETSLAAASPPIIVPVGQHLIELRVDGLVVASEDVAVTALHMYSLVGYGDPAAPQELYFAEPIPGTPGAPPLVVNGVAQMTIINLMPGGPAIYGLQKHMYAAPPQHDEQVFVALPYGETWSGPFTSGDWFNVRDHAQPDPFLGGFGFGGLIGGRMYIVEREPVTGDLFGVGDSWFQR